MKEYLSQKGVQYTERNVAADVNALNELRQKGFRAVPVTMIDGQSVMGFDRAKLDELLGKPS
ncbi:MAG: glutaredoxin family protein [Chloroflexota bacterium]